MHLNTSKGSNMFNVFQGQKFFITITSDSPQSSSSSTSSIWGGTRARDRCVLSSQRYVFLVFHSISFTILTTITESTFDTSDDNEQQAVTTSDRWRCPLQVTSRQQLCQFWHHTDCHVTTTNASQICILFLYYFSILPNLILDYSYNDNTIR